MTPTASLLAFLVRDANSRGNDVSIFFDEETSEWGIRNGGPKGVPFRRKDLDEAIFGLADNVVQWKTELARSAADEAAEGEDVLSAARKESGK